MGQDSLCNSHVREQGGGVSLCPVEVIKEQQTCFKMVPPFSQVREKNQLTHQSYDALLSHVW
jgi:hypothetical protein